MIPPTVNNHPVLWVYRLDPARFPAHYAGDGPLEKTSAILLSIADEGSEDERFWITCLGESGRLMAGEMYYKMSEAKRFPHEQFGLSEDGWEAFEATT